MYFFLKLHLMILNFHHSINITSILVEKSFMDNTLPTTRIKKLELSERITEIARMLGGEEAEKTSLDHARSLLQIK